MEPKNEIILAKDTRIRESEKSCITEPADGWNDEHKNHNNSNIFKVCICVHIHLHRICIHSELQPFDSVLQTCNSQE